MKVLADLIKIVSSVLLPFIESLGFYVPADLLACEAEIIHDYYFDCQMAVKRSSPDALLRYNITHIAEAMSIVIRQAASIFFPNVSIKGAPYVYSYSKIEAYKQCPYQYALIYHFGKKAASNGPAEFGTLMHSIFENYTNHMSGYELKNLIKVFKLRFTREVAVKFPEWAYGDMGLEWYKKTIEFLHDFKGYDDFSTVATEYAFAVNVDNFVFQGRIDYVYYDNNGKLYIRVYKSGKVFTGDNEKNHKRQLYLYCLALKRKPDFLEFHFFNEGKIVTYAYNEEDFKNAVAWLKESAHLLIKVDDFMRPCRETPSNFCAALCGCKEWCFVGSNYRARKPYTDF